MAKYEMLIAASGKRGSALLPCVVVDEKGIKRADERDKAAQIFTWCMVVAMHQEEGIGATRLERACNEMHEFQQRYRTKILTENRKSATDAMREDLKGICDFEVRLPQTKAPRNRREEQLRMAQNEGAEIA